MLDIYINKCFTSVLLQKDNFPHHIMRTVITAIAALTVSMSVATQAHAAGTVEVLADQPNVAFELTNLIDGSSITGVTPAVFTGMPPVTYSVRYAVLPSCEVQEDMQRELINGSKLIFWANFHCGDRRVPPPPSRPNAHTDMPAKRIVQTVSQSEVVAGGHIRYTLTLSNMTRGTLHNVDVVDRFNPEMIDIVQPLLDGGIINGSEMVWNIPKIYAGKTWSTSFTVRAKDNLVAGDRIVLMAHAYSDEADFDLYPEAWSSVAGVGVAYMPQTGGKYDVLFALAALIGAAGVTNMTIRKKQLN